MDSRRRPPGADSVLLLASAIWGFAFVAQRVGMEHVGPFTFNGIRFALGALAVLVMLPWLGGGGPRIRDSSAGGNRDALAGGLLAGLFLFLAASFQQVGMVYTTAGNAGFITGLYVVLVPVFGLLLGRRPGPGTALGAVLAFSGLYLLSVGRGFTMSRGDFLVLISALFWTGHVLVIGRLSGRLHSGKLALAQYSVVSASSMAVALMFEDVATDGIVAAAVPLLYGGLASVGIAYTLQIIGQRRAHPAHASIILSLEAVFAAFGGWLLLGEVLGTRGIIGACLMLAGMLLSQLWSGGRRTSAACATAG